MAFARLQPVLTRHLESGRIFACSLTPCTMTELPGLKPAPYHLESRVGTPERSLASLREIQQAYERAVVPTYARLPFWFVRGEGCRVWDQEDREYLDFGTGIAVCSLGHAHPGLSRAIADQASTLVHISNLYYQEPQLRLAEKLIRCVGQPGKVFFCNSGAEANEAALKLAQRVANLPGDGTQRKIITFQNSFHGRTIAGISATGQDKIKAGFGPLVDGFIHLPFNHHSALEQCLVEQGAAVVAIMLEPVQGEGGIHPVDPAFLSRISQLCQERGMLLILDEVQSGLGRTGDWCSWHSLGLGEDDTAIFPDVVTWAKGLASGFPLGAVWISERSWPQPDGCARPLCDLLGPGTHGTTYGGSPLAARAGLTVLEEIQRGGLLDNARRQGERLEAGLRQIQDEIPSILSGFRGLGLMWGLQLAPDLQPPSFVDETERNSPASRWVSVELARRGLLVIPSGTHVIRLLPPLIVNDDEVQRALGILSDFFRSLT